MKNKIDRALIIILALIWNGIRKKPEEAHSMVSKYVFPYLVLGSGPTQSTLTLPKDASKESTYGVEVHESFESFSP